MDAHNLTVVICPNLVSGPDPLRDVAMCAVPGCPTLYDSATTTQPTSGTASEGKTTLGTVIKLCIQRYYEIFDEVQDRSEAVPRLRNLKDQPPSPGTSSVSSIPKRFSGFQNDDDEDIDDAMLVMPIGPSPTASSPHAGDESPSPSQQKTWGPSSNVPYKARQRNPKTGGRSVHTTGENGNGFSPATFSKTKSLISIDNGQGAVGTRRGSISVGRGTTRKSSGAGVEAISVTAGGFFSAPHSAPPVPRLPSEKRRDMAADGS